ncbi:uncharacterized protein BP01DRAFT_179863 [Aspergillus saccharolyticus JOP 1030-1]|uniref:Uncharacterized protein n=1 Tax=Aspergillus saccharolyticus JOP 1030-1 TaxID=1450539 RepID=A0A318ZW18_9EURO|nr:hypothetical protein BP01DRAFT_179863 [Aspergillus saccharolyticus JOP 1030-1]PYH48280.1 hypothetical protein BP01DRAFT_179863 [Aspergillus saccharolyticus JOP 1030-1]
MGTTSVRRNLFHHHLSRRAGSVAPSSSSAQSNANHGTPALPTHMALSNSSESVSSLSSGLVDNGEIVVRDKNGSYKIDIPILPAVVSEGGDEMEGIEEVDARGVPGDATTSTANQTDISGREKEKIEANLLGLYRNKTRRMSSEPAEILNLVQRSLRNKVAALDEDNWMYEPEVDSSA